MLFANLNSKLILQKAPPIVNPNSKLVLQKAPLKRFYLPDIAITKYKLYPFNIYMVGQA